MTYENGDKYEGTWKSGVIAGTEVKFIFANGDRFTGDALGGKFEGNGTLFMRGKGTYKGNFLKG